MSVVPFRDVQKNDRSSYEEQWTLKDYQQEKYCDIYRQKYPAYIDVTYKIISSIHE